MTEQIQDIDAASPPQEEPPREPVSIGNGQQPPRKQRKPVLRWKGIFGDIPTRHRRLSLAMIALVSLTLGFSQFGFAGIGLPGEYAAYAVFQLLPVALAALLFGTGRGTLMGLFAGAIMFLHANWMPLDYYEMEFVTPFFSFLLFPLTGFLLGILLSLAFRNERGIFVRSLYITFTSFIVSTLFTFLFSLNVFAGSISYLVQNGFITPDEETSVGNNVLNQILLSMSQMGDIPLQIAVDALSMAAVCILGTIAVRQFKAWMEQKHSVRVMFNLNLGITVLGTFMVTATISFACITLLEISMADSSVDGELEYLYDQYKNRGNNGFLDGYNLDKDGLVLFSYTPVDSDKPEVFLDNLPQNVHPEFGNLLLSEVLTAEGVAALEKGLDEGSFTRVVYDPAYVEYMTSDEEGEEGLGNKVSRPELRYVKSLKTDSGIVVSFIGPANKVHAERPMMMLFITLSILVLLFVVFTLTSRLLKVSVVSRIDETNETLESIAEGDVTARAKDQATIEFSSLSAGINTTVGALEEMIHEAETRRDAELAMARVIQESALPRKFPAFPDIDKFDIYASMKPAKEVGGDFYDFFKIPGAKNTRSNTVTAVIADISGKGVPGALKMMTSQTQIRNHLEAGLPVDKAINGANHRLCLGNDAGMFATALVCTINYETGHVEYVNAGHNPPLVYHDGEWTWRKNVSGMPLGLFDGIPYEKLEFDLSEGDIFFMYTDGVTEAMNEEEKLFGEDRLKKVLSTCADLSPREIDETVRQALADFVGEAEQSDDITILTLKYGVPPEEIEE